MNIRIIFIGLIVILLAVLISCTGTGVPEESSEQTGKIVSEKTTENTESIPETPPMLSEYDDDWKYDISKKNYVVWDDRVYSVACIGEKSDATDTLARLVYYDLTLDAGDTGLPYEIACQKPGCLHCDGTCYSCFTEFSPSQLVIDREASKGKSDPVIYSSAFFSVIVHDPETGVKTLYQDDGYCFYEMCLYGDYIFCNAMPVPGAQNKEQHQNLIRIRKDGSCEIVEFGKKTPNYYVFIGCYENYLYYATRSALWRIDIGLDDRTAEKLFEVVGSVSVLENSVIADGYLYYGMMTKESSNIESPDFTTCGLYRMKLSEISGEHLPQREEITPNSACTSRIDLNESGSLSAGSNPLISVDENKLLYAEDFFYRILEWDAETGERRVVKERMEIHADDFIDRFGDWYLCYYNEVNDNREKELTDDMYHYIAWNMKTGELKELIIPVEEEPINEKIRELYGL